MFITADCALRCDVLAAWLLVGSVAVDTSVTFAPSPTVAVEPGMSSRPVNDPLAGI